MMLTSKLHYDMRNMNVCLPHIQVFLQFSSVLLVISEGVMNIVDCETTSVGICNKR